MSTHGGNITPSPSSKDDGLQDGGTKDGTKDVGPKTPINANKGKKTTQIELTPIESLLFFNMVRFNGNRSMVDWAKVAEHSNLKNAASAKVRFRQILKKHGLMDKAPETPRSQAQKRKAVMKSGESGDDDEDGGSSYTPSHDTAKAGVRKRSAPRASGSRAKRTKASLASVHDQDDDEAISDSLGDAPALASSFDDKIKVEGKTRSEPGSDDGIALLNDDGVEGAIDGTASISPYEQNQDHRQSALSAHLDDTQALHSQYRHPGMVPNTINDNGAFCFGHQLSPGQLAVWQAPRGSQLQPQQLSPGQLHRHQLNHFQAPQMFPYQTPGMHGGNLVLGYMDHAQLTQHFPVGAYNGVPFVDQAQLGNDVGYDHPGDESLRGRVDGQDEWDLDNRKIKREASPEGTVGLVGVYGDEDKQDDEPCLEDDLC